MDIKSFNSFLNEHKLWDKSIPELLNWIELKSSKPFVWLDTETTGLPNRGYEIQLTQIASIITNYSISSNSFTEIDTYNKKIKLTDHSLRDIELVRKILSFNHYGEKGASYYDEKEVLQDFFEFLSKYDSPILAIQNAEFDMRFLNTRNPIVRFDNEVIDTKQILQLYYLPLLQKLAETDESYHKMITLIGTSDRDSGLISSSLSKVGPAMGINMSGYHDALVDCRLMMQMFQKMIDLLVGNQDVDISKYQGDRIRVLKK